MKRIVEWPDPPDVTPGVGEEKEVDLCEFGIEHKPCYFCGQPKTISFSEHFTFCPNCSAIYTVHILQKSGCEHIKEGVPFIIRDPWYAGLQHGKPAIRSAFYDNDLQVCDICGEECQTDGW